MVFGDASYLGRCLHRPRYDALNPDEYFIVVVNQLGSGLSTSPHDYPGTFSMGNFPKVRISDDVSRNTGDDLAATLGRITAETFVMPISHDWFFPPEDCRKEQELIPDSEFRVISSSGGHLGELLGS